MVIVNRLADMNDEVTQWRRDFHQNPELLFDVHRTAACVAEKLRLFGCDEVVTGIGQTGVVGIINGQSTDSDKVIGLRADMDALPIQEETGKRWASQIAGKMHACGHDGHTAMLLGAAKYLAETRHFNGTAVVVFQPAEEGGGGGREMVNEGLMERFNIQEIYGMHNMPGLPIGHFAIRSGPIMAAADRLHIEIEGVGGHAAKPHLCVDPIVIASNIIIGLQTIVSRSVDPMHNAVVSITAINAGDSDNVIPPRVLLRGTARTLNGEVRDLVESRIHSVVSGIAKAHGACAKVIYKRDYPVTVNHGRQTQFAAEIAESVVGGQYVDRDTPAMMGGEDFSFMLEARPGAFIFAGNGETAGLHHPEYDFNDDLLPYGMSYWIRLIEMSMPV